MYTSKFLEDRPDIILFVLDIPAFRHILWFITENVVILCQVWRTRLCLRFLTLKIW